MANTKVYRTAAGWCKRIGETILGPFDSQVEARSAYEQPAKKSKKIVKKAEAVKVVKTEDKKTDKTDKKDEKATIKIVEGK